MELDNDPIDRGLTWFIHVFLFVVVFLAISSGSTLGMALLGYNERSWIQAVSFALVAVVGLWDSILEHLPDWVK